MDCSEGEFIALGQKLTADLLSVDFASVGRTEVDELETVTVQMNLRVMPRGVGIAENNGALRDPSNRGHLHTEPDALAVRELEVPVMLARRPLIEAGVDPKEPDGAALMFSEAKTDGAEEAETLGRGMVSHNGAELGDERVVDVGESFVIWWCEVNHEVVRGNASAPDIERAIGIEVLDEATAYLDGL